MKLPEWRPIPQHLKGDNDTKDAISALRLIGPVVLILLSFLLVLLGLLA